MTQAATIPRASLKEMGISQPWNWRLTVPKTTGITLTRPSSRWLPELTTLFYMQPLPLLTHPWNSRLKALTDCQRGSQPLDINLPACPVASTWNKAPFPFHQACQFIGFRAASNPTPLLITVVLQKFQIKTEALMFVLPDCKRGLTRLIR